MTIRTLFSTLLIFALPLLMLGCDGGGSAMEQEPQQMEEWKLSIYHPPETNAQTNGRIQRSASELQEGDKLNVFVTGDASRETFGVNYPASGETAEVTFTVPDGKYDVDLLGFRDLNRPDKNSGVVFATTGTGQNVDVNSGEVTTVNFQGSEQGQNGVLSYFDLTFNAKLEFSSSNKKLDVTLEDGNGNPKTTFVRRLFDAGQTNNLGGIGIDPNNIDSHDRSSAQDGSDFGTLSYSGATFTTSNAVNLAPEDYRNGKAVVLLELQVDLDYVGPNQDPVYLYNNVDGSVSTGVNIGGDGGIIVII